jgi:hypothetical protein
MRLRGQFEDHVYPADSVRAGDVDHVFRDESGTVYLIGGADVPLPPRGAPVAIRARPADRVAGPTSEAIWVLAIEPTAV